MKMNFYSLSLLLLIFTAYAKSQDEQVVVDKCPICDDECLLGREMDEYGCEICHRCNSTGIFESDILISDPESYTELMRVYKGLPQPRGLQRNERGKWPKNGKFVTIPFAYDSTVSFSKRNNIEQALAQFENRTCIRFSQRSDERSYLHFVGTGGCSSYVGRTGSRQAVSIGEGCDRRQGTIIHEIMHALGFWHEQSRGDRDDHVTILWDNIRTGASRNFQKQEDWDSLGSPYDTGSVMHYGGYYFSKSGKPTIVDKQNKPIVAQRYGFSAEDVNQINTRYDCSETEYPRVTTTTPSSTTTQATTTTKSTVPTTISPEQCVDQSHSCESWKNAGYCSISQYVKDNCVQSCTGCEGVATSTTTDATTTRSTTRPTTASTTTTTIAQSSTTTTEKPTITSSSRTCLDQQQESTCQYWKEQGYCGGNFEQYMMRNCEKTCGYCVETTKETTATTTTSSKTSERVEITCSEDVYSSCSGWAERNFCNHTGYRNFMKNSCAQSCADNGFEGFCESKAVETTTPQTTTTTRSATTTRKTTTTSAREEECYDTNTNNCEYWEGRGYCNLASYTSYMERNCRKACGFC